MSLTRFGSLGIYSHFLGERSIGPARIKANFMALARFGPDDKIHTLPGRGPGVAKGLVPGPGPGYRACLGLCSVFKGAFI